MTALTTQSRLRPAIRPPGRSDTWLFPAAALAFLASGVVATMLLNSPVWAVLVVLVIATATHSRHVGWRLAFALVLLGSLVAQLCLTWVTAHLPLSLDFASLAMWTLVGVVHIAASAYGPPIHMSASQAWDLLCASTVPALIAAYLSWRYATSNPTWIAWGMVGDAPNNVIYTRQLVTEDGLLASQANPAPLATALNGIWSSINVDGAVGGALIRRIILAGEQLGVVLWLAIAFAAAVIALGQANSHRGHRLLVAATAGAIPWLWFASGYAFQLGYQNVPPAILILLLTWLAWRAQEQHPITGLTALILGCWSAGAAWGPLGCFAGFLIIASVLANRKALLASGRQLALPVATFVAAAAYALLITVRDVSALHTAFAADGATPPVGYVWICVVVVGLAVALLVFRRQVPRNVQIGFWVSLAAGGSVVAYLLHTRGNAATLWGYYPLKFSWITIIALFIILFGESQHVISAVSMKLWRGSGVILAVALVAGLMFKIAPPVRPVSIGQVATPIAIHNAFSQDATVSTMFDLMAKHPRNVVARYSPDPAQDQFLNYWLLQMGATSIQDPLRISAYVLGVQPADPASVCDAINDWADGVQVWTADPAFVSELKKTCDTTVSYTVKVVPAPPLPGP